MLALLVLHIGIGYNLSMLPKRGGGEVLKQKEGILFYYNKIRVGKSCRHFPGFCFNATVIS